MCHTIHLFVILSSVVLQCYALSCRSEGGPKEEDLKAMYMACLKKNEGGDSNETKQSDEQEWKDSRGRFNPGNHWSRDGEREHREDRTRSRGDRNRGRGDNVDNNDRPMGNRNDRNDRDRKRMGGRDDRGQGNEPTHGNKHRVIGRNEDFGDDQFEDFYNNFPKNFEFDIPRYNVLLSTTQPSRRFKRSRRTHTNSGQRSQYNPNTKMPSDYEDQYSDDDRNSSNTDMNSKSCALHCFLEELEMTDDEGMPDKYLVTQVITQDVKNEDLMDFLQESIEECFQILENEKNEDKCELSKLLMMCLSEKGKSNCDDWKDDMKF